MIPLQFHCFFFSMVPKINLANLFIFSRYFLDKHQHAHVILNTNLQQKHEVRSEKEFYREKIDKIRYKTDMYTQSHTHTQY